MTNPLADSSRLPSHDIICIDCKSFYASTEAVRRGIHPLSATIAVMSHEESAGGLILAASPETKARYGVKLGTRRYQVSDDMAIELVEPRMADYIAKNGAINRIYRQFTDDAHWYPYSIDESFIDVTHSHSLFGTTEQIAATIQARVFQRFGILTTVGMGPNMLLAKLALDNAAKAAAPWRATWQYEDVFNTVWQIPSLTDCWGIGPHYAARLERLGISNIKALAQADPNLLQREFGVMGLQLYYHAWGIDYADIAHPYVPQAANKGYGNSQVLMRDYTNLQMVETVMSEIADQVATRLRNHHVQCRLVSIFLGFAEADEAGRRHLSAQMRIPATNRSQDLILAVRHLVKTKWQGNALRQAGVRCSQISPDDYQQIDLFTPINETKDPTALDHVIDTIRAKYGYKAIVRGFSKTTGATAIDRSGLVGGHRA